MKTPTKYDRIFDLAGVTALVERHPDTIDAHGRVTRELLVQHADGAYTLVGCTSPTLRDAALAADTGTVSR